MMIISPLKLAKSYRLSSMINTAVGCLMLLLAFVGLILENTFPALQGGGLVWGFLSAALLCIGIGFYHRRKALSLGR